MLNLLYFIFLLFLSLTHSLSLSISLSLSLSLCCSLTLQQGIPAHIGKRGANSCFCRPGAGGLAGGLVGNGIMNMQREVAKKEAFDYPIQGFFL